MQTYISILRGINVGGNRILRMEDLREWYANLGFIEVQSYIQSGNLIFRSARQETAKLESAIAKKIFEECHLEVPVVVLELDYLKKVIASNHFLLPPEKKTDALHITFLSEKPTPELLARITPINYLPDQFHFADKQVYLHCPNGYGQTKLTNNFFESKLKMTATTRNWKTLIQLISLAEKNKTERGPD